MDEHNAVVWRGLLALLTQFVVVVVITLIFYWGIGDSDKEEIEDGYKNEEGE